MQLNSLSLNSSTVSPLSKPQLALYDHKLAVVNRQIFVFGKNIQNFTVQTPLHKITMPTLTIQHVFSLNAPLFHDFIMFSVDQQIYFWGKTSQSQENLLFQFDGTKFNRLDQTGTIPDLQGFYSYAIFSHQYLLLFGNQNENQFLNKWYFLDIRKRDWKSMVSDIQIPVCQKSSFVWKNGRGYLLLQSIYHKLQKSFKKNILYEVKIKDSNKQVITCSQIPFSPLIQSTNVIFTDIISFSDNYLMILGGEQSHIPNPRKQSKINYDTHKMVYKFDLEQFQWLNQYQIVPLKGQNHQITCWNYQIFAVGGNLNNQLLNQIQTYDFRTKKEKEKFPYEQSLCYYCESAFTYDQSLMYSPKIQKQYDSFCPKNRIQSKFLRKFAQTISTQIHAIGILCEFFIFQHCAQVKINLCQQIKQQPYFKQIKAKVENQFSQILVANAELERLPSVKMLAQIYENRQIVEFSIDVEDFYLNFTKIKLASFKLGYAFLYVTSTLEGQIFVGYISISQTDFPESNVASFSEIFYMISANLQKTQLLISSTIKRQIIFQNVKLHFGSPEQYQNGLSLLKNAIRRTQLNQASIFIIGVTNLEKGFDIQLSKNKYFQDIRIKNLNKNNPTNSLRNYLKHFYLSQDKNLQIFLQNQPIQLVKMYDKYLHLAKSNEIKEISTSQDTINKNELEQTHFSTNQDETIVNWRKIQIIEKCKLYEVNKNKVTSLGRIYGKIFLYKDKKLIKAITSRKQNVCGIIELVGNIQTTLDEGSFANKVHERKIIQWIQQISSSLNDEFTQNIDYI